MNQRQRQRQAFPMPWPVTTIPPPLPVCRVLPIDDVDLLINYNSMQPGPPGPPGPQGPKGDTGSLANVPITLVDEATYSPTVDEYFLGVIYNGTVTITLPVGVVGKSYIIKDSVGDATTNPITVTTTGSTIDGEATYVLDSDWSSIGLVYNGIEWNVV